MSVNEYTWKSGVNALTIEDKNTTIILKPSVDNLIRMSCFENKFEKYEAEAGESVKIKKVFLYRWFHCLLPRLFHMEPTILYLPKSFDGKLSVRTANGSVQAEGLALESMRVATMNGRIEIAGIDAKGELKLKSGNGIMQLTNVNACDIGLETSNGGVRLDRVNALSSLEVKTTNGSVNGNLCGKREEYALETRTVNGRSNLHGSSRGAAPGSKRVYVDTVNGSIDLTFAG